MLYFIKYIFLIPLAILSFFVLKGDYSIGKIRNKIIIKGFIVGFVMYGIILLWTMLGYLEIHPFNQMYFQWQYFADILLNMTAGIIMGYFFWYYGIWAPGDAKFFYLCIFLLPLDFYWKGYFMYFPASALLINIFIFSAIIILVKGAKEGIKKIIPALNIGIINASFLLKICGTIKNKLLGRQILKVFLNIGIMFFMLLNVRGILLKTLNEFSAEYSFIIFMVIFFLVNYILEKYFFQKKTATFILCGIVMFYVIYSFYYFPSDSTNVLYSSLIYMGVFKFITVVLKKISEFTISKHETMLIHADKLQEGMFPVEDLILNIKKDKEVGQKFGNFTASGLTDAQANLFKKFMKNTKNSEIIIYKAGPFSGFIVVGVVITVILNQSFAHLLIGFFRDLI